VFVHKVVTCQPTVTVDQNKRNLQLLVYYALHKLLKSRRTRFTAAEQCATSTAEMLRKWNMAFKGIQNSHAIGKQAGK